MRVTIRKKNLDITPALADYIEKKMLKPVKKLLQDVIEKELPILDLQIERTTRHHHKGEVYRMEVNLSLGKHFFNAVVDGEDIYAVCDLLEKELEREITSVKGKTRAKALRQDRRIKKELRLDSGANMQKKGRNRNEG